MAEGSLELADPLDPNDTRQAELFIRSEQEQAANNKQAFLRSRKEAYIRLFHDHPMAGDAAIVLADLKRFCRGNQTPWHEDQRIHALLSGRSEVYTRVIQHLTMSFDDLWEMYNEPAT